MSDARQGFSPDGDCSGEGVTPQKRQKGRNMQTATEASRFTEVLMTPKMAAELLEGRPKNRNIAEARAARIATDIREGRWIVNGDTIRVGPNDELLDGQHRLRAVVIANKPVPMTIFRCASESAIESIDTGRARTVADILAMRGVKDAAQAAAAISHYWRWVHRRTFSPSVGASGDRPTTQQAVAFYEKHPDLVECAKMVRHGGQAQSPFGRGWGGAIFKILSDIDYEECRTFFRSINSGVGFEENDPRLRLLNRLRARPAVGSRISVHECAALTIRAWNYWRSGTTVRALLWRPTQEAFPVPRELEE